MAIGDKPSIVDLMARALRETGYLVDGVTRVELAVEKLRHERYDQIISDIKMPGMDGAACEEEVRAMDPSLVERIVSMTVDLPGLNTQAFLERWEGMCIKKPFSVEQLRAVVAEALGSVDGVPGSPHLEPEKR